MLGAPNRPIGYWLRHLDRLITDSFDRTLQDGGLTRRHWQILNVMQGGSVDLAGLAAALAPFAGADPGEITVAVEELGGRGWIRRDSSGRFELTAAGLQAHQQLLDRVEHGRRIVAEGISEADYLTTMAVLQRMSANLEAAAAAV